MWVEPHLRDAAYHPTCLPSCSGAVTLTDALCSTLQIKCDQYWPSRGTETYGMTQVTLLDTIELATFCVRTFSLHKVRGARLC